MLATFVHETSSAPGTAATINLAGAVTGRDRFRDQFSTGATVFYIMDDGTQAEWGYGTLTHATPDTLTRTVISTTAGSTSRLNFTGTVNVYSDLPASRAVYLDASGLLQNITAANLRLSAEAPAIPTASAGVAGEWKKLTPGTGNAFVLPAGGTWSWACQSIVDATGVQASSDAGSDAAGGSTVRAAGAGIRHEGFCWRTE